MVSKARFLLTLYEEMEVPKAKLIFRLPATWEGIQAASQLEKEGIATQVFMVYSLIQGAAAAQAGVSVVQPNVGRTRDWYNKHPGVIRDPRGPREDTGFASRTDPGVALARQIYCYVKAHHPKTQVMASGLRSKDDALALAGCDYLVLSSKIMDALEGTPTIQGYNDGMNAGATSVSEEGVARVLSLETAKEEGGAALPPVTAASFADALGVAGKELLDVGLKGLVQDVEGMLPYLRTMSVGSE